MADLSRRALLSSAGFMSAGLALAACSSAAPSGAASSASTGASTSTAASKPYTLHGDVAYAAAVGKGHLLDVYVPTTGSGPFRADGVAEYWRPEEDRLSFSLERARHDTSVTRRVHIAFAAKDRAGVDRFHAAAVSAGAVSRHAPRFWPEYRAYCAFLRDPDGNNIEALHKEVGD